MDLIEENLAWLCVQLIQLAMKWCAVNQIKPQNEIIKQIEYEKNDDGFDRRGPCMVVCSIDSACDEMICCKPDQTTEWNNQTNWI